MFSSDSPPLPEIDTAVDVDGNFVYDPTKTVEENYTIWLGFIYDTFAGIANGDNYIELIEQFADENIIAVTVDKGDFYNLEGLPEIVLGILRDPMRRIEDLANCPYTLDVSGGLHLQADKASMLRLKISNSSIVDSEILIHKNGEELDEPVEIMSNNTLVGTISQRDLLTLLVSMNSDSSLEIPKAESLTPDQYNAAFELLLRQLGEQKGCANTEDRMYGAIEPEMIESDIANGGIVIRRLENPEESLMQIDIVHHEILSELDSDVIYRLHSELIQTSGTPTPGNAQRAQKIIKSPATFNIRNLTFTMEYSGTVRNIDVDQDYMVRMIRVVQELLGQIAERG